MYAILKLMDNLFWLIYDLLWVLGEISMQIAGDFILLGGMGLAIVVMGGAPYLAGY